MSDGFRIFSTRTNQIENGNGECVKETTTDKEQTTAEGHR